MKLNHFNDNVSSVTSNYPKLKGDNAVTWTLETLVSYDKMFTIDHIINNAQYISSFIFYNFI